MEKSKVYFTDMRCQLGEGLQKKLDKLIRKAGIEQINFDGKFVAVKIHFGEPGNLSFLRPNFAKTVVERIKELGGRPFLTDCSTLYVGRRGNALDHLGVAAEHGFTPLSTGCEILIGDGLKGNDDIEVPVAGGKHFKTAQIGRAVMDADIFISLNHFKGHELTGFGGAIKNIGMGCGSRAGKMQMHSDGKPNISDDCRGCGVCFQYCAQDALYYDEQKKAHIHDDKCVGCGRCIAVCRFDAIGSEFDSDGRLVNEKMVEYTKAVLDGRPHFHVNIVNQVSPFCDCHAENDAAIVPDIGMFASFDPVALDKACADAVNRAPALQNSSLTDIDTPSGDHFCDVSPTTDWRGQIHYAEELNLGSSNYELITL